MNSRILNPYGLKTNHFKDEEDDTNQYMPISLILKALYIDNVWNSSFPFERGQDLKSNQFQDENNDT